MNITVNISEQAASWLERQAKAEGIDQAQVAARALELLSRNGANGDARHVEAENRRWADEFARWTQSLPRCGGKSDPARSTIYD